MVFGYRRLVCSPANRRAPPKVGLASSVYCAVVQPGGRCENAPRVSGLEDHRLETHARHA